MSFLDPMSPADSKLLASFFAAGSGIFQKLSLWAGFLVVASLLYGAGIAVYRIWFHPLSKFPGPSLLAVSSLPFLWQSHMSGTFVGKARGLHEKYGKIVRIAPNRLMVDGNIGWADIYAHRPGGDATEFRKVPFNYFPTDTASILGAPTRDDHRRHRRQLAHAFSDAAMVEQEPIITYYIDLFIQRLSEHSRGGSAVNMLNWLNFVTFDIVGDLSLGESFHSLARSDYHPWVLNMFRGIRGGSKYRFYKSAGPLLAPLGRLDRDGTLAARRESAMYAREKAEARISLGVEPHVSSRASGDFLGVDGAPKMTVRRDFMTYMMRKNSDNQDGLAHQELLNNAFILITAGSETTGTNLANLFFMLSLPRNRRYRDAAVAEVRGHFSREADLNLRSVGQKATPFLHACIEESLRFRPPVVDTPPRISPGAMVGDAYVPKGTFVSINQIGTNHNPENFAHADSFRPERFLPAGHPMYDPQFAGDNFAAFRPFSFGPRDCVGKNLAYAEMHLVAARVLLRFDLALADGERGESWQDGQRVFGIWEKPPLMLRLTERTDLELKGM